MRPTVTLVPGRFGLLAIRSDCNCGLCRRFRDENTTDFRTLAENARRGGAQQLRANEVQRAPQNHGSATGRTLEHSADASARKSVLTLGGGR